MRRSIFSNTLSRLAVFILNYPVFCFFVFISVILMLITLALFFGALNYKWEKRCARMLIFSMIPVCTWMAYFYKPVFSPLFITIIIWLIFPVSFIINKIKDKLRKDRQQSEIKGWTCRNCRGFNEDVFLVCKHCNLSREENIRGHLDRLTPS